MKSYSWDIGCEDQLCCFNRNLILYFFMQKQGKDIWWKSQQTPLECNSRCHRRALRTHERVRQRNHPRRQPLYPHGLSLQARSAAPLLRALLCGLHPDPDGGTRPLPALCGGTDAFTARSMYILLGNFSLLELCYVTTTTVPNMLASYPSTSKSISFVSCLVQFSFFSSGCEEGFFLCIMAFDRHLAVCRPPRYPRIMTRQLCTGLVVLGWSCGFTLLPTASCPHFSAALPWPKHHQPFRV